ncbi:sensor histidine kinase [Microbacterium sp. Leaf351]|uniref:sensor histidine kinase n=1 Tax=Microbacterium sp. Leaf351 TaxID=1736348 RepID=UPI000AC143DF|nr:sensor histidine kinase [Microbacterium sp. Leaf351]
MSAGRRPGADAASRPIVWDVSQTEAPDRVRGMGWPVLADGERASLAGWRATLATPSVRGWYVGGAIALPWLFVVLPGVLSAPQLWQQVLGSTLVLLFAAAFLIAAPTAWATPRRGRIWIVLGLFALSFALMPWLGWDVRATWTFVGVVLGVSVIGWRFTWIAIVALGLLAFGIAVATGVDPADAVLNSAIIVSISLMMAAFARTLATLGQLRRTQAQVEVLAADRERSRVARDIHDILGHSLTVITVKAELAGRLIDADPQRAGVEIGEVEALARGALADVRAAVSGFREVNVSAELAAARAALRAAGIELDASASTDAIDPAHRELAGWVVREGVTNVIRHAGASRCRIRLEHDVVEVADDGVGPGAGTASTGLTGLRERADAAGARLRIGRSDLGGFSVRVEL